MGGGSSERLVLRASRRRGDTRAKLTKYITVMLAALLSGGGSALLFLVPLYADPALSALAADFDPVTAECVTERRDDRLGLDNCTWASCREGCTSDAYKCTQLHVKYKAHGEEWRPAVLYVNVKGCGYPPAVDCDNFTISYGYVGARYPCYWSRADTTVVVPNWSRGEQVAIVTRTLALPLFLSGCAGIGLCALHCECRPRRRRRPPRRPPCLPTLTPEETSVYRLVGPALRMGLTCTEHPSRFCRDSPVLDDIVPILISQNSAHCSHGSRHPPDAQRSPLLPSRSKQLCGWICRDIMDNINLEMSCSELINKSA